MVHGFRALAPCAIPSVATDRDNDRRACAIWKRPLFFESHRSSRCHKIVRFGRKCLRRNPITCNCSVWKEKAEFRADIDWGGRMRLTTYGPILMWRFGRRASTSSSCPKIQSSGRPWLAGRTVLADLPSALIYSWTIKSNWVTGLFAVSWLTFRTWAWEICVSPMHLVLIASRMVRADLRIDCFRSISNGAMHSTVPRISHKRAFRWCVAVKSVRLNRDAGWLLPTVHQAHSIGRGSLRMERQGLKHKM